MFLEIVPKLGLQPLRIEATQLVIRNAQGTPIAVAGEFGPDGTQRVAHVGDKDFDRTLRAFGYTGPPVQIDVLELAKPQGATLANAKLVER